MSRDPILYLDELIEAAQRAIRFGSKLDDDGFVSGEMAFEAIVRQIEIIGEAAARIAPEVQARAPEIPWSNLVGMRHRLIHGYFAVDPDIVRSVVRQNLPKLLPPVKALRDSLQ